MHGAYESLFALGEDIRPPGPDPGAQQRFALLAHVGRLAVECHVDFQPGAPGGYAGSARTSTPRTSTPRLVSAELRHSEDSLASLSSRRHGSLPRPRDSRSPGPSGSRGSPPSRPRPSVSSAESLPGSATFGAIRPLRLSASAEPLRPSFALSRSDLDLSESLRGPPAPSPSPSPSPLRSFRVNYSRTVLATYAERPRSLSSDHSLPASTGRTRRHISRPFPLRPMPLSPLEPPSPDFDIPKVNSYPRRGIGRKIKRIASKLSQRSVK